MGKKNRKCSKIDRLPVNIKEAAEQMMLNPSFRYSDIVEYIKSKGYETSLSGVARHAKNLAESASALKMAQENFKVIMQEIDKYPNLDTTEAILRLLSSYLMEAINNTPEEKWQEMELKDIIKQSTALTRAAAYKQRVDAANKDSFEKGLEYVKNMLFETFSAEEPELYKKVEEFLKKAEEKINKI